MVCKDEETLTHTVKSLNDNLDLVKSEVLSENLDEIIFNNGSLIKIIVPKQENPDEPIRGKRINFPFLYDDFIVDEKTLSEAIKEYYNERVK
jgi:hypothetical protein